MEPKFQSSFIPKGPTASSGVMPGAPVRKERNILSFVAMVIFILSVVAAVGVFGYKFYLSYSIKSMATELEARKANLEQETVDEIRRLNNRILATEDLLESHIALSPLFGLLESSTLSNVRFTNFDYRTSERGFEVLLQGEARGYAVLALQADLLNKNKNFINPVFSDLSLDDEGNVVFSFRAHVSPTLLSYKRGIESSENLSAPLTQPVATSTSTTPSAGTTTPSN